MVDEENRVPTVRAYPLEKAKIIKKFIGSEIGYGIIFIVLFVVAFAVFGKQSFFILIAGGLFLFFLVITGVNFWYQGEYYRTYYYDIRPNFLVIKKGVFMPTETTLPYEKLQDIYLDQDFLDRVFGLWDLHVSTATFMSGFHAHIDGVNIQNGEKLRELLLAKIKEKG